MIKIIHSYKVCHGLTLWEQITRQSLVEYLIIFDHLRFPTNSEANSSELLENLEKMIPR